MSTISCLVAAISIVSTTSAWGQDSSQRIFSQVRSGQVVRIRTHHGQLVQGQLFISSPSEANLQTTERKLPLSATSVDSLWIRGNRAGTGAIIGAVVLGVPSIGLWKALCDLGNDGNGCQGGDIAAVAALSALTAGVGAGIGALIGSASPRWRLHSARPGLTPSLRPNSIGRGIVFGVIAPL